MKIHKNDNQSELLDFYQLTLYMIFSRKKPLSEWPFWGKSRKSYIEWILENPEIYPSYHFCNFASKIVETLSKVKEVKENQKRNEKRFQELIS